MKIYFRNMIIAILILCMLTAVMAQQGYPVCASEIQSESQSENGIISADCGISADSVSDNDTASADSAVSEDIVSEDEIPDYTVSVNEAKAALQKLLAEKNVMALVYNGETYDIREKPDTSSAAAAAVPSGTTAYIRDVEIKDSTVWFKALVYQDGNEYTGYIEKSHLAYSDEDLKAWEDTYLSFLTVSDREIMAAGASISDISGFPASYQSALSSVAASHPNWVFVPYDAGVSFEAAVAAELSDKNKNWIYYTAPDSYKNGATGQSKWYYASEACLRYYMDPRNFLTDKYLFQFEQLTYNSSYHTAAGLQTFLSGCFMKGTIPGDSRTYAQAFFDIGSSLGVSPYHLASRVYEEQGVNGSSALISGTYSGYENLYNYFNVGASGANDTAVIVNGLTYARQQGWNTRYKSLYGGSSYIASGYILKGQDELYLEKYNVGSAANARYTHQYMQNAQAPSSESVKVYNMYNGAGAVNNAFVFKIPVFTDMGAMKSISLSPASLTWKDFASDSTPKQITATVVNTDDSVDKTVTWKSSDPSVAQVSTSGLVTPLKPGKATVTASAMGISAKCTVKVRGFILKADGRTVSEDSDYTLIYNGDSPCRTISTNLACSDTPVYSSSNTGIVKITTTSADKKNALFTAVGIGMATVKITADGVTRKLNITVKAVESLAGCALNTDSEELYPGGSFDLYLHAVPYDLEDPSMQTVSWNMSYASGDNKNSVSELSLSVSENAPGQSVRVTALSDCAAVAVNITGTLTAVDTTGKTVSCSSVCRVTTKQVWSAAVKDAVSEAVASSDLWVFTNRADNSKVRLSEVKLSGISLPAGTAISWELPAICLTASSTPVQYFNAVVSKKGFTDYNIRVPVHVSRLKSVALSDVTGVTDLHPDVTGKADTVAAGGVRTYRAVLSAVGDIPASISESGISLKAALSPVNGSSCIALTGTPSYNSAGYYEFSISCNSGTAAGNRVRLTVSAVAGSGAAVSGRNLFTAARTIKTVAAGNADAVKISLMSAEAQTVRPVKYAVSQEGILRVKVSADDISRAADSIGVEASAFSGGAAVSGASIIWSTSDRNVASVSKQDQGVFITLKKAGTAVITAKSNDSAGAYDCMLVSVVDSRPLVEASSVTLSALRRNGADIDVLAGEGCSVNSVQLNDRDGSPSEKFTAVMQSGDIHIAFASDEIRKQYAADNKNVTLACQLVLSAGKGTVTETVPLKICVTCKKPTVKFRVIRKANMFYVSGNEAEAVYFVTSNVPVTGVKDASKAENMKNGVSGYVLDSYSGADSQAVFRPDALNAGTLRGYNKKVKLTLSFDGYDDITYTVNIATVNTAPAVYTGNAAVYSRTQYAGTIRFRDKKTKKILTLPSDTVLNFSDPRSQISATGLNSDGQSFNFTASVFFGSRNIKYTLTSADWLKPVTVSTKFFTSGGMSAVLGRSSINLNTNLSVQKNSSVPVSLTVKDSETAVQRVTVGAAGTAVPLITSGYLHAGFSRSEGMLYFGLNQGCRSYSDGGTVKTIKAGTYKITLTAVTEATDGVSANTLNPVTLKIVIQDKATDSQLSFAKSGNINLVDRQSSCTLFIPKISLPGAEKLSDVTVSAGDLNAADFKVSMLRCGAVAPDGRAVTSAAGAVCVQAVSGADLGRGVKYPLRIKCLLDNKSVIYKTVTVVPSQKAAGISVTPAGVILSAVSSGTELFFESHGADTTDSRISSAMLVRSGSGKYFDYGSGGLAVRKGFYPRSGSYQPAFRIRYADQAVNSPDYILRLKVTVR